MSARTFTAQLVFAMAGFLIWFAHFNLVYAVNAVACARGFAATRVLGVGIVPLAVLLATAVALAALGLVWRRARVPRRATSADSASEPSARLLRYLAAAGAAAGLVAVIWQTVPALMVAPCG